MRKIIQITQGIGGEYSIVEGLDKSLKLKNISTEMVFMKSSNKNKSIGFKKIFDEELITFNKLKELKDYTINSNIIFYHYIFNFSSIIFLAYLKFICKKKIIGVIHTNMMGGTKNLFRELFYYLRKFLIINALILFLNRVIFVSSSTKEDFYNVCLFKRLLLKKSKIILNFIESNKIIKNKKMFSGKLNILYVGRLSKFKGFNETIKIIKNTKQEEFNFIIIGKGKLEKRIPKYKNIKFIKEVLNKEIYKYYDQSSVLIFPSYSETFGLVILEAMARGLVVLASDLPAIREYFVNGRNGYLFPPGDVEKMKELILYLKNNPKEIERISKNNLRDIWKFTAEKQVPKYIKVYEEVLKESKSKK